MMMLKRSRLILSSEESTGTMCFIGRVMLTCRRLPVERPSFQIDELAQPVDAAAVFQDEEYLPNDVNAVANWSFKQN